MNSFHQPHTTVFQLESDAAIVVGASRQLLGRIQTVDGNDQRVGEGTILEREPNRKVLTGAQCVRIPLGHELEREAERPVVTWVT